jgi:Outer membrane protein beta-barrel domain
MQKKWLLFVLLAIVFNAAKSQDEASVKRFGISVGTIFSHMDFSKGVPPTPTHTSWNTGINFGFVMTVPIVSKLSFQPEYLFSQTGGKVKNADTTYKFNYLSLPLFLKLQVHEKFALMAGPQFDILIHAKRNVNGGSSDITHDTEERGIDGVAGIEFRVINSLVISARYIYGFNHIGLGQHSDIQEFKFRGIQLMACARF